MLSTTVLFINMKLEPMNSMCLCLFQRILDFLCMDSDDVSTATMCPTTQCTTCWCPLDLLDSTKDTFPFCDTVEVCSELQAERERLLDPDGTPCD